MEWVLTVLKTLLKLIFGKSETQATAEERAGRAEAQVQMQEKTNAAVQAGIDARRAVERDSVREPEGVRKPDRYSRD